MINNYPPGVTGSEYEIAGPDWEREVDDFCSRCDIITASLVDQGYGRESWTSCMNCGWSSEPFYDDPMDYSDDLRDGRNDW